MCVCGIFLLRSSSRMGEKGEWRRLTSQAVCWQEAVQVQVGVERNLEIFGGLPQERDLWEKHLEGSGGSSSTETSPQNHVGRVVWCQHGAPQGGTGSFRSEGTLPQRREVRSRSALVSGDR